MKLRLVLGAALVAAVGVVPSATARTQRSQSIGEGVATSIVAEVAKTGIKAGIAAWAPDLVKYSDPTAHGLAQIQEQLAQLDAKITQLGDHQLKLANQFDCVTQRTDLLSVVTRAQSSLQSLTNAVQLTDPAGRAARFERMFQQLEAMQADQLHIHQALVGPQGVILSCARFIESGYSPYLNSSLATTVHDFYATYKAAAVALVIVRANLMALHPEQFTDNEVKQLGALVEKWINEEERLIKPHFPKTMLYDSQSGTLWWTEPILQGDKTLRGKLQSEGWHVTGHSTIPTCSAVLGFLRKGTSKLGGTGVTARGWINAPKWISCYDDHDKLHDFNLDEGRYEHYGYAFAGITLPPSVAARQNNGLVRVGDYSYLHG